jgi:hypothetical protein
MRDDLVFETHQTSQGEITRDLYESTVTGVVSSLHTDLSETHPGVSLNRFLMSLGSLKDPDSRLFLSPNTNQWDPTKIHLTPLKCHTEEAEAVGVWIGILSEDRWGELCWDVWFTASY